tara:strand:+ start:527 stop:817 length:291 start_codon:yes stop_codon:yes gene_type:complete
MPWNKDGSRKKSAFYLKSGNKASYNDLQVDKQSPLKLPIIPAVIAAIKGLTATQLVGAAATGAASAAGGKAVSGGKNKDTAEIISGEQKKIMEDEE